MRHSLSHRVGIFTAGFIPSVMIVAIIWFGQTALAQDFTAKQNCTKLCDINFVQSASVADYKTALNSGNSFNSVVKNNGWTPLLYLLRYSDKAELIQLAIDSGKNIDHATKKDLHPLHLAAQYQPIETFQKLRKLARNKTPKTSYGATIFHFAAANQTHETMEMLLNEGFDVNVSADGWTPIKYAARYGNSETIKKLLAAGADINTPSRGGWNLFLSAAQGGTNRTAEQEIEVLKTLLDLGIPSSSKTDDGRNAIHIAASFNKNNPKPIIEFLSSRGVDIDAVEKKNQTALHLAANNRNLASTKALLELGVDPNVQDNNLNTALMTAVWQDKYEVSNLVALLIENGAMAGAVNKDNFSAYGLAFVNKVVKDKNLLKKLQQGAIKTRRLQMFSGLFYCQDKIWTGGAYRSIGDEGGHYAVMYELMRQRTPQMPAKYICANQKWSKRANKLRAVSNDMKGLGDVYAVRDVPGVYVYIDNVFSHEM